MAMLGFSLVMVSLGYSLVAVCRSSLQWLLLLQSTGFQGEWASIVVVNGLSRWNSWPLENRVRKLWHTGLVAPRQLRSGMLPDQRLNLCLLHWQVDSLLLCHQGSAYFQPFYIHESESVSCSVVFNSLQPHGLQPARLLCSMEFSQIRERTQVSHCKQILYRLSHHAYQNLNSMQNQTHCIREYRPAQSKLEEGYQVR